MMGRVPLARINDELVRVGDFAGESFKVVEILPLAVTLEADGKKFTLELAEESSPKARQPKK